MWKKFKALTTTAKWMIVIIIVALIAIATRWRYICEEAGEAFRNRFEMTVPTSQPASQSSDSAAIDKR